MTLESLKILDLQNQTTFGWSISGKHSSEGEFPPDEVSGEFMLYKNGQFFIQLLDSRGL